MSILIKGMEMPASCCDCPIGGALCCSLMPGVPALWKEYTIAVRTNRRHSDCPLIEVPPHGRLIDADELLNAIKKAWEDDSEIADVYKEDYAAVSDWLYTAPTIISADKDGGT